MNTWWLWILGALVCGIVEVMSVSFVFLMFAIGALAAGIAGADDDVALGVAFDV